MSQAEKFIEQLERLETRLDEINTLLSDPKVLSDPSQLKKFGKERSEVDELVGKLRLFKASVERKAEAEQMLAEETDEEMRELAETDLTEANELIESLSNDIETLLFPADPNDNKNVIVEIRAGTGGEEAALFAGSLFRMYTKFAESQGWDVETMHINETGIGGIKEVVFNLIGRSVYGRMKYESGVHRVQRVPETEASGRVHTSAATVAVLPEAEEVDLEIREADLRVDVYRASGPGGQGVNTTDSAVRITHVPTNVVVTCQDERSQLKNKAKAMKILRSRLLDEQIQKVESERRTQRRSQVSSGDRSAKIRTYNFPQGRVTDHRSKLTLYKLGEVLEGDLREMIDGMVSLAAQERLEEASSEA
ncbi:MAG: peptide chain release factor 1 [Candidatus Eisenbacteria bacterium]|uniref:Peptide chain release factor 1 n=1 Tax=Eiseniibacteriota bacterium TaxID=2212470 RepID=A0A7Y2E9R6_UNCEI|nr:peptide chain release factor 1 [Candidatus Eisenbacteria bacterium]